jgi:hypothetical protein
MKIAIELNGVLRDTLKKIQQEYEKWYIENPFREEEEFEYEVLSDVTSLDIGKHLKFKTEDELYDFLYKEHTMEIFGHAGSVEPMGLLDLNDFYLDMRENHDILIVSDEIGKSKPASLDILLTANPKLLLNHPEKKIVIKFETVYNKEIDSKHTITSLKELKSKIEEIQ